MRVRGDAITQTGRYIHPCGRLLRPKLRETALSGFDNRKSAEENKFALDQELRFKANARRNRLLGQWAAEKLGLTGDAAAAYAKEVVMADFEEAGDDDVLRKVSKDLADKGVAQSEHQIRRTMDELMAEAVAQIEAGN